ncbi:helix-turn-helix domain-containing protein [uncultured Dysosmobacter sp.]|uniref:helix-turn-helix domain-containing protein n=1 Tax=uncultured Dysosmobacter sp. TaxID=2591384 RepID=UPI002621AE83|nr:helix-turn-helix transcriptional regulator [uncultured Dysosmobacter sp.]
MNKSYFYDQSNLISQNLRRLRRERGMSQEALAAQMQLLGVDINQRLISKIERNERFVKDFELVCFCRVLSVTERDLLADFYETLDVECPQ